MIENLGSDWNYGFGCSPYFLCLIIMFWLCKEKTVLINKTKEHDFTTKADLLNIG